MKAPLELTCYLDKEELKTLRDTGFVEVGTLTLAGIPLKVSIAITQTGDADFQINNDKAMEVKE